MILREAAEDLIDETRELLALVEGLDRDDWERMTPAEPWTIRDQIGHLAYFDEQASLAVSDPQAFADHLNRAFANVIDDIGDLHRLRRLDGPATIDWFRTERERLADLVRDLDPDERIPWYGPPMRATTFVIARLMETWAHGTDVADALGGSLPVTDRLFHVAGLGVRTFSWSFTNRGLDVPPEKVRVTLTAPSGTIREWNEDCSESVSGSVEDFCLVVAQRRHVDDTSLDTVGPTARRWMEIAQVFAGPPGAGRPPSG